MTNADNTNADSTKHYEPSEDERAMTQHKRTAGSTLTGTV